ncbi:hypothetical protein BN1263250064 [Stenotrophomonas indicatrix]|nr:hypothetical protein BN1263250064 [Stenotrophomonas indicatrix]
MNYTYPSHPEQTSRYVTLIPRQSQPGVRLAQQPCCAPAGRPGVPTAPIRSINKEVSCARSPLP